jgi:beta-galactosidase/beta-glucuronidase
VQTNPAIAESGPTVRAEYPRPRLVRSEWASLNGEWEFAFDPENVGLAAGWNGLERLDGEIVVPFAYQTAMSGVDRRDVCEVVWYARGFEVPLDWEGRTVLLHFGAVDYEASVWVNGQEAGHHRGGYSPFSFDVTSLLKAGENRVSVRVFDSQDPGQARGKQSCSGTPFGIDYWCTTGIWQPVWLEPVGESYLQDLIVVSDAETGSLHIRPVVHQ